MPKTHLVPRALPKKSSPRARFHRSVRGDRGTNVRHEKGSSRNGDWGRQLRTQTSSASMLPSVLARRAGSGSGPCTSSTGAKQPACHDAIEEEGCPNVVRGWLHFVRSLKGKRTKQVMFMAGPFILAYLQGPAKTGRLARRSLRALSRPVSFKCP